MSDCLLEIYIEKIFINLNLLKLSVCFQSFSIFVRKNHTLVQLKRLLCNVSLYVIRI